MIEEWKPIPGNSAYYVSNTGRVMNGNTKLDLKPRPTKHGYLRIHISINGERKDLYIHRLVAEAFCEHPSGCDVINHIDNDPQNNRSDNLEWVTQRENVYHGMKQKRYRLNAIPIVAYKDGESLTFDSVHQAGAFLKCDSSWISKVLNNKRKSVHGYTFKYAEVSA